MKNISKEKLPSAGLLGTDKEVTIRGMVGKEISTIYSSLNEESIDAVIKAVTDPSLDPKTLCDEDKHFILHKTRTLTFGDEVTQTLKCPFCKHIEDYTIDYKDFDLVYLENDQLDKEITLSNKDVLIQKIPKRADWVAIDNHKKKRNLSDDYAFILLTASRIKTVNGEKRTVADLVQYLENMRGNDLVKISKEFKVKFGLNTTFIQNCGKCKLDITGGIGINADMFR